MSSVYKDLNNVRKPRVHITYDVETNGAVEEKELPFVVGVMGDYSGNASKAVKTPLRDKKFIDIDNDNFDQIMSQIKPGLELKVANKLDAEKDSLAVNLQFRSLDDFSPDSIVQNVKPLKDLLDTRARLHDLASKCDRSEKLEAMLEDILSNTEKLQQFAEGLAKGDEE